MIFVSWFHLLDILLDALIVSRGFSFWFMYDIMSSTNMDDTKFFFCCLDAFNFFIFHDWSISGSKQYAENEWEWWTDSPVFLQILM